MLPPRTTPLFQRALNGLTQLKWRTPPRNIFVAKKDFDVSVVEATRAFIKHVTATYDVNILVEPDTKVELGLDRIHTFRGDESKNIIDLVVTFGGDGTILRASSLFMHEKRTIPPILSFSMGTLGFLLPFDFNQAAMAFEDVYSSRALVLKRARLGVTASHNKSDVLHAINDLTIHRGSSPHLTHLDISVNGDHVTTAIADGLAIATPTGSTAYSLSAGGSIVHPFVKCTLLTPICPRSLSFRPLIFPKDASISITVGDHARGPSELSLDGFSMGKLERGDTVEVHADYDNAVWCVTRAADDWILNLNGLLGFNSKFGKTPEL